MYQRTYQFNYVIHYIPAQNFVRLFNADRGRKGGGSEVTDLDVVMTNIEEVALEIKYVIVLITVNRLHG